MSSALPNPSRRLLRAAAAEHADLTRHRERLTQKRERALADLRRLDQALAAVEGQLVVLRQLTGTDAPGVEANDRAPPTHSASASPPSAPLLPNEAHVLGGPAIREVAVQVLISQPEHIEALHYRRWYELLTEAGYAVAGKDPVAVFLTQVTRSPVVRRSAEPGVYEVDRQAPIRIRRRLERLQAELREITIAPRAPLELADVRARRHELDLAISQQERALEEALRVLCHGDRGMPAVGAVGAVGGATPR